MYLVKQENILSNNLIFFFNGLGYNLKKKHQNMIYIPDESILSNNTGFKSMGFIFVCLIFFIKRWKTWNFIQRDFNIISGRVYSLDFFLVYKLFLWDQSGVWHIAIWFWGTFVVALRQRWGFPATSVPEIPLPSARPSPCRHCHHCNSDEAIRHCLTRTFY